MTANFRKGDRVKVASRHQWIPERYGTIKEVENRVGNRYLIKFDVFELGMWHDEDREPVLRLGDMDLVLVEAGVSRAA